jgi:predicted nucleic acid-binding protein
MILVDTSVWVDHLRAGDVSLAHALNLGQVLVHPFVLGELACGNLRNRQEVLGLLRNLPEAPRVSDDEAHFLIENRSLMGRGVGYIDVHLLASVLLTDEPALWTRDKRLAAIAGELSVLYEPEVP